MRDFRINNPNNKIKNIAKNKLIRVGAAFGSPFYEEITQKNKEIFNRAMSTKNGRLKSPLHIHCYSSREGAINKNAGITLVALIITIILLLILAGITLHFTLGENGILKNAEIAGNKYKEASENETNLLDQAYAYMNRQTKLQPNTPETTAGTPVQMPNNWYIETPTIYVMPEAKEIENYTFAESTENTKGKLQTRVTIFKKP